MESSTQKKLCLQEFELIPGVGKSIALDFWDLGFRSLEELKEANPEKLYADLCTLKGCHVDRCMLYVFRCAVYFVSETEHDPALLKWWNWKDNAQGTK